MFKLNRSFLFLFIAALCFTSCEKDEPEVENEEELITTLIYTLTPAGGDPVELRFTDLDGDGGNDPVVNSQILSSGTTYTGAVRFLNESEIPAEEITEEIEEEDAEHQVFFQSSISGLSFAYTDMDGDGNPIGLASTLTTGDAGSGTLTVTLRHEPSKSASGVADGNIANAGGETDIEVTFNVSVQ